MEGNLASLEAQVAQVVELVGRLRGENESLRSRLAEANRERDAYADKLDAARARLEVLVDQLPDA